jgi:hypothetical protein
MVEWPIEKEEREEEKEERKGKERESESRGDEETKKQQNGALFSPCFSRFLTVPPVSFTR